MKDSNSRDCALRKQGDVLSINAVTPTSDYVSTMLKAFHEQEQVEVDDTSQKYQGQIMKEHC